MFQSFTIPYRGMPGIHTHRNYLENLWWPSAAGRKKYRHAPKMFRKFTIAYQRMCGGVSIPTKIISAIYPALPMHVTKGMGMRRKCFGNLPLPTNGCAEVYPYPPKSCRQFTLTYRCMSPNVWACTKNVSVIYHLPPTHAGRCIHTPRTFFGNLWWPSVVGWQRYGHAPKMFRSFTIPYRGMPGGVSIPTEIVLAIYGDLAQQPSKGMSMHWKCFGNLPLPTDGCAEVYPYTPKLFRQFMVTFRGRLAKVSCTENVSVIYRYLPTDVRRCIHTHRNCFGNLPLPTDACHQMYEHAPKMFRSFTIPYRGMPGGVSVPT